MINRIIDFSVNNKVIVFIIVVAACVMGWWSIHHLPLDAVPDLTDTQVTPAAVARLRHVLPRCEIRVE